MTAITELGYFTLGVSNLAGWEGFAATILGLEVMPGETADVRYLRMDYWHHRIKLVEDGSDDLQAIGLRLAGTLELRAMVERLEAAGVAVRRGRLVQYDLPFHPGRRMHGRIRTGSGGMGHMLLNRRADFEAIHAFYTLLGMRGGIEYRMPLPILPEPVELMFLHCNDRQHSLAFGPPGEKAINHFMMEMERFRCRPCL